MQWDSVNGVWVDITSSVDTDANVIYGETTHLSLFGVMIPPVQATVDIAPDVLNLRSKGKWITCYIELLEGYDIEDIDVGTILLNDTVSAPLYPTEIGDYDGDEVPDLMVKFDRRAVNAMLGEGDAELKVTGNILGETETTTVPFEGSDTIRAIMPGKGPKK